MPFTFPLFGKIASARKAPAAANDNPPGLGQDFARRVLLRAALRHLAAHGVDAAALAYRNAELALVAGSCRDFLHWLAICRVLDRRLADAGHAGPWLQPTGPPN